MSTYRYIFGLYFVFCIRSIFGQVKSPVGEIFSKCVQNSPEFDICVKDSFNKARPYFTQGAPELQIPPLDPWRIDEWTVVKSTYTLTLSNFTEIGWEKAIITDFKSNIEKKYITFSQIFTVKIIAGNYKVKTRNGITKGSWNMTMYNLTHTTILSNPKPGVIKVSTDLHTMDDFQMYIENLGAGDKIQEIFYNTVSNSMWRMGYPILKRLIEELIETGFSKVFSKIYGNYNWDLLFPNKIG